MVPKVIHRPRIRKSVWDKVVKVAEEEGIRPNRLIEDALEDYLKALREAKEIDRKKKS